MRNRRAAASRASRRPAAFSGCRGAWAIRMLLQNVPALCFLISIIGEPPRLGWRVAFLGPRKRGNEGRSLMLRSYPSFLVSLSEVGGRKGAPLFVGGLNIPKFNYCQENYRGED